MTQETAEAPPRPTSAAVVEQVNLQLTQVLVQRSGLYDQMESSDKTLAALRNTLSGIELGKKVAAEAARAAQKEAEPKDPLDPTE